VTASILVSQYLEELRTAARIAPVLDLACGTGRNGLFLVENDIPVVFADIRQDALDQVRESLDQKPPAAQQGSELWRVDFEESGSKALGAKSYGAILVFRYLHRPLMAAIERAVIPGGLIIYETFTVEQPKFGRPTNPDFLLEPGELPRHFPGWNILHEFEGEAHNINTGNTQAIAQMVARKPG
jgi:SAM-dependent methyltransferase